MQDQKAKLRPQPPRLRAISPKILDAGPTAPTLKGHSLGVKAVAFSKDGKTLASASVGLFNNKPGEVKLWDVATGKERFTLKEHAVWTLAFSPDGEILATGSTDGTVKLWDPVLGKTRATLEVGVRVYSVAFSGDGKTLVTAGRPSGDDYALKLWDVTTRKVRVPLGERGGMNGITAVAFSPDSKTLASVDRDTRKIELWDLATSKSRVTLMGDKSDAWSMAFSKDGKRLAVAGGEFLRDEPRSVTLWDVPTEKIRATLKGHTSGVFAVVFSPV